MRAKRTTCARLNALDWIGLVHNKQHSKIRAREDAAVASVKRPNPNTKPNHTTKANNNPNHTRIPHASISSNAYSSSSSSIIVRPLSRKHYSLPQSLTACTAFEDTSIRSASIAMTLLYSGCALIIVISSDGDCKCAPSFGMSSAFVSDDITWESSRADDPGLSPSSHRKMEDIADIADSLEAACNYSTTAGAQQCVTKKIFTDKKISTAVPAFVVVYCATFSKISRENARKTNSVLAIGM